MMTIIRPALLALLFSLTVFTNIARLVGPVILLVPVGAGSD